MANLNTEVPTLKLNDGSIMPMLGFGTGTAMKKKVDEGVKRETVEQIKTAIKTGYMHLDSADTYNTESDLGVAIKESKVSREKLFVTTKIWRVDDVPAAIDASLKRLQLTYVDLYLIHCPFLKGATQEEINTKIQSAWSAMEAVKASGKAKSIGISNFLQPHLEVLLAKATTIPSINQIEYHLYLQHGSLLEFHAKHGIAVAAYGPITPAIRVTPGPCDDMLAALAKKYYVNEADVCLRWIVEKGVVAVTTTSREQRMSDSMRITAFKMTPREVEELGKLGLEKHFRAYWKHKYAEDDRS